MAGRGGDDDDDIFARLLGHFMGPNIDEHFQEMTRQMDAMFKHFGFGDMKIQGELPPPPVHGGSGKPPFMDNPREQMLKNPYSSPEASNTVNQPFADTSSRPFSSNFRFPPFSRPGSDSPFGNIQPGETDRLSNQQAPTDTFVSSWSSSWNQSSTNDGQGWNKTVIQTVRHPDGTVERIEKSTQNGRTCTTTTTTDPQGVTSTNTVCDRPAIDGPLLKDGPGTSKQSPEPKPVQPLQPNNSGYSKDDISFFKKMFGFDIFKPKD